MKRSYFLVLSFCFSLIATVASAKSEPALFNQIAKAFDAGTPVTLDTFKRGSHVWVGECVDGDAGAQAEEDFFALTVKRNREIDFTPGFGAATPEKALNILNSASHSDYYSYAYEEKNSLVQLIDGKGPAGEGSNGFLTLKGFTYLRKGTISSKPVLLYKSEYKVTNTEDNTSSVRRTNCYFDDLVLERGY